MNSLYLLPLLFFICALSEENFELDNVEKDQLEITSSKKSSSREKLFTDETKYSAKVKPSQSQQHQYQYHGPTTFLAPELGNQLGDYAEAQVHENFKFAIPPQVYIQKKYAGSNERSVYTHQSPLMINPTQHNQQYYIQDGQTQSQNDYIQQQEHQHEQEYQTKTAGNNMHNVEQKTGMFKDDDNTNNNRDTYYVNIPMSELLDHYRNYGIIYSKNKNDEQQISIPVYTSLSNENQVYNPMKVSYRPHIQYLSYPKYTQAIFTKGLKGIDSNVMSVSQQLATINDEKYSSPMKILAEPEYKTFISPPSSPLHKSHKYEYYTTPRQLHAQYADEKQFLFINPENAYMDIYNSPGTPYVQNNLLYDQHKNQYYVPMSYARQLMMQVLHPTGLRSMDAGKIVKQENDESRQHNFSSSQYEGYKFHGTTSTPISSANIYPFATSTSPTTDSKSLLDSYVPSHVIAAQDINRYKERPIKLESGFLPSKINFIHSYKKRKIE